MVRCTLVPPSSSCRDARPNARDSHTATGQETKSERICSTLANLGFRGLLGCTKAVAFGAGILFRLASLNGILMY